MPYYLKGIILQEIYYLDEAILCSDKSVHPAKIVGFDEKELGLERKVISAEPFPTFLKNTICISSGRGEIEGACVWRENEGCEDSC